jgi:hypothetical protein
MDEHGHTHVEVSEMWPPDYRIGTTLPSIASVTRYQHGRDRPSIEDVSTTGCRSPSPSGRGVGFQ